MPSCCGRMVWFFFSLAKWLIWMCLFQWLFNAVIVSRATQNPETAAVWVRRFESGFFRQNMCSAGCTGDMGHAYGTLDYAKCYLSCSNALALIKSWAILQLCSAALSGLLNLGAALLAILPQPAG